VNVAVDSIGVMEWRRQHGHSSMDIDCLWMRRTDVVVVVVVAAAVFVAEILLSCIPFVVFFLFS
jgi:hypothetical protein